jgi:putative IMPACT (imprinted ancient) family translation regulator
MQLTLIDEESFKYSDDGEPNGTAGIRILNAIKHFNLSNVLAISTRYYGGSKLGVGPLGKAYYNSALGAIETAKIITQVNYSKILITFGYDFISDVHHFINNYKAQNINNLFNENPQIECMIKPEFIENLRNDLTAVSSGQILIKTLGENIFI